MNWYIGQKVVSLGKHLDHEAYSTPGGLIDKGEVCVIGAFVQNSRWKPDVLGLIIIGRPCICKRTGVEVGWDSRDFAPLQELREKAREKQKKPTQIFASNYNPNNP